MSRPNIRDRLARKFPGITESNFDVTSPVDYDYNCIAWALGNRDFVCWPKPELVDGNPLGGYFWPYTAPLEESLEAFVKAFRLFGYEPCESELHEPGYEKVAIYVEGGRVPTHAARQLDNGRWSSKLGPSHDVEHDSLELLTGKDYGLVGLIMRRPLQQPGAKQARIQDRVGGNIAR